MYTLHDLLFFFCRVTWHYASAVYAEVLSVLVSPSNCHKLDFCEIGWKRDHPHNATRIFWCHRNSNRVAPKQTPNAGGGRLTVAIFSHYLAMSQKRCKIGHSYYGRLTETRMRSVEWRYFQWPWLTPNYWNHPTSTVYIAFHVTSNDV